MQQWFQEVFQGSLELPQISEASKASRDEMLRGFLKKTEEAYERHERKVGSDSMRTLERHIVLDSIDSLWKDHLLNMDHLKEGIGLRAYGQKDPLIEYKREGYEFFARMMASIKEQVIPLIMRIENVEAEKEAPEDVLQFKNFREMRPDFEIPMQGDGSAGMPMGTQASPAVAVQAPLQPIKRDMPKVGRNDPCPCGSGKKYKKCHGANA
jgi:preprotein translocase subunit SecA